MRAGIADALRSDDTPPLGEMVSSIFSRANPQQQAGMLNQILGSLGPGRALVAGRRRSRRPGRRAGPKGERSSDAAAGLADLAATGAGPRQSCRKVQSRHLRQARRLLCAAPATRQDARQRGADDRAGQDGESHAQLKPGHCAPEDGLRAASVRPRIRRTSAAWRRADATRGVPAER